MLSALVRTAIRFGRRWLGLAVAATTLAVSPALALDHSRWTEVLAAHVRPGADGVNRFD